MATEQRPGGHFDRFTFCNGAPGLEATNVQFQLLPGPAGSFPAVPQLACAEQPFCGQNLDVTGFTCDATVVNHATGQNWHLHWDYSGPHKLQQIAIGIVEECPDGGGAFNPVGFGVAYYVPAIGVPGYILVNVS